MTAPTPNVPLRLEFTVELAATPEQVWDAIATGNGITAWFMPTEVDEGEGGTVLMHMGDDDSPATITGWEPPHRLAYVEPDWATLAGNEGASVTGLATEFLVEAKSGGTCVLRVVTSAFGTGAQWEQEFFDDMATGWRPYFENLRLYLANFPGQQVTSLTAYATVERPRDDVWAAMRRELGADAAGQAVAAHGIAGTVERLGMPPASSDLLIRLSEPLPGYLQFAAHGPDEGPTMTFITGYLFSQDAPAYVDREQPTWKAWLEGLAVPAP
jgi:uncharacterized protein YndB with AHSA1/START domain